MKQPAHRPSIASPDGFHLPTADSPFHDYLEATPFGLLVVSEHGIIVRANPSVHRMFGYDAGELTGSAIEKLVPMAVLDRHVRLRDDYLRDPNTRMLGGRNVRGRRKDGAEIHIAIGINPLHWNDRTWIAATLLDLTDIKTTELDFSRYFELSLDLFCLASPEGFFLRVNSNFSRVLGYEEEELRAHPFLDFVHGDDQAATSNAVQKIMSGTPITFFRNRYRHKTGDYHWFEWTGQLIPNEKVIFAMARDISERVRMEREMAAREERERAILDNTRAVIYVKDVDGRYQFVNRRYGELFELERGETIGKTDEELFPSEHARQFSRNDRHVCETGETITVEEVVPHADGEHTYVSVKFPLRNGEGRISAIAGISTDITDQLRSKETEHQLGLAMKFQQRLYPLEAPSITGLDVAGLAVPVSHMCGDYYDYIVRDGGRLAVTVGDVTGHGFGPALQMVEIRAILRMLLRDTGGLDEVVAELNRQLVVDMPESSFISLFVLDVDARKRTFSYVGGGHQGFLIKANGEVERLKSTGPLLGILELAEFAVVAETALEPGDTLIVYTDGITESISSSGEQFGDQRALEVAVRHRREDARAILNSLFAAVFAFADRSAIHDDMTAVAIKG